MFAEKLSPLIHKHPDEADGLRRMANFLLDYESRKGGALPRIRLNPNRMFDIMQAGSAAHLAILTQILVEARIIRRFLIVRCPSGEGLTFKSYSEIPPTVRDPGRDVDFEVTTSDVEPTYQLVFDEAS